MNIGTFKNHVSAAHNSNDQCVDSIARDDQTYENSDSSNEDSQSDNPDSDLVDGNSFSDTNSISDAVCVEASNADSLDCFKELLQKSSALFLLGLKEKYKLTQGTIQGIIEGVTSITQQRISILKSQVCILYNILDYYFMIHEHLQVYSTLSTANITPSHVEGLDKSFNELDNIFFGLETQHQQLQYMKRNFNLIVSTIV